MKWRENIYKVVLHAHDCVSPSSDHRRKKKEYTAVVYVRAPSEIAARLLARRQVIGDPVLLVANPKKDPINVEVTSIQSVGMDADRSDAGITPVAWLNEGRPVAGL